MKYINDISNDIKLYEEYISSILNFLKTAKIIVSKYEAAKDNYSNNLLKYKVGKEKMIDLIQDEFDKGNEKLETKKKKLIGEISRYNLIFEEGSTKFGKITPEIANRIQELKEAVVELIGINLENLNNEYKVKIQNIEEQFRSIFSKLETDFEMETNNLLNDTRNYFSNTLIEYNNNFNNYSTSKDESLINKDISVFSSANYSTLFEIGTLKYEMIINDSKLIKEIKVIVPFLDNKSILIIHDGNTIKTAENIHDTLLTRALLSNEVGKVKLTLSDLKGLGDFYREFIPLTHEVVSVANGKPNFEKVLAESEERIQNISVRYTVSSKFSNFSSLGEYNSYQISQNKNEEIIPHFISVVQNLSYDVDESLNRKLNRQISNGAKNGTQFIIIWNKDDENDKNTELLNEIIANRDIITIDLVGNNSNYLDVEHQFIPNKIPEEKKHELVASFNHQYKEISSNMAKEYFVNTLPSKEEWFKMNSSEGVKIPVGKSKNHRGEQVIELKTNDTQAHLLCAGGTGSGKTNFMKTFITSAALHYSPNDLEFYLIDLKNGIGFDIFRKHQLPHVKMFAMGAENELILNLLDELNDEMLRRFNLFVENGVEDIAKYNLANPDKKIKRTLLIVDEFFRIFEDEKPYQDEIVARISPLAKQGRAAGINLFFSTQNFNDVSHSFSKLKSQMPVRVVLKSSLDAASALLDSRNDAMKSVNTIGEGVLNYRGGNKLEEKDNEFFKVYLLENEDLKKILTDLRNESHSRNYQDNELIVYNNLEPANIRCNSDLFAQIRYKEITDDENNTSTQPILYKKFPVWLGEPTTVSKTHFQIELERNFNENILVTGIDKNVSINAVFNILSSLAYTFASGEIAIRVFSFLNDDENQDLQLPKLEQLNTEYDYKFLTTENYQKEFQNLYTEYEQRHQNNNAQAKRIFAIYIGLEKAKNFFKEESYSMSKEGEKFYTMLENGNAYNIHSIAEVRQPSILYKKIFKSDNSIAFFKHRIVFNLGNGDESTVALGNKMAGALYKTAEPHTRYRAIYYNADFEKDYSKIKPYIGLIETEYFVPKDFGKGYLKNEEVIKMKQEIITEENENETDDFETPLIIEENNEELNRIKELKELLEAEDDDTVIDIDDF